ncbi:MAG: outer membrane protein assembly factor BamA, partial [Brevundimonas diminuta]|nr:outer membrane protein assembly factor BamA [Brevundimonas diminuta]
MIQTPGRILGVSALALTFAAGLAQPALAQQAAPAPALAPAAAAQTPQVQMAQPQAERAVVNRIVVRGNQRIDQTTVLSYLPIQPGDTIDAVTID